MIVVYKLGLCPALYFQPICVSIFKIGFWYIICSWVLRFSWQSESLCLLIVTFRSLSFDVLFTRVHRSTILLCVFYLCHLFFVPLFLPSFGLFEYFQGFRFYPTTAPPFFWSCCVAYKVLVP